MANTAMKIDLHMNSTVSDGTDQPRELLERVKNAGISCFSVTDHDAVKANYEIMAARQEGDPRFIPGVEFSCEDEDGKYHILGYGFDLGAPSLAYMIQRGHNLRMDKVRARLDFLKTKFGFVFPEEEVEGLLSLENPGKPHIGNLMVKYGYTDTKERAIREYIDQLHFKDAHFRPEEAITAIMAGGGVPILAHPFFGDGNDLILGEDMEKRLEKLVGFGLQGLEAFYSGFSDKLCNEALTLAERFELLVTAGSDYHGKNKLVQLGDTGLARETVYPMGLQYFLALFLD